MKKTRFANKWIFLGILLTFSSHSVAFGATELIPVGRTVGVTLDMKGVTVVDTTDVEGENGQRTSPAEEAGLLSGDVILEVNGREIGSAGELEERVRKEGKEEMRLKISRHGEEKDVVIKPSVATEDGNYRMGVWVKDAASGIGTVTYLNPQTMEFGALGHPISEEPDGNPLWIEGGEILDADLVSVQKGDKGQPGELVGVFSEQNDKLGEVSQNTPVGLIGTIKEGASLTEKMEALPIADRAEVEVGAAEILSNIEEGKIQSYQVEIQKINKDKENPKGMVIKVTDPILLEKTGGIVQGM